MRIGTLLAASAVALSVVAAGEAQAAVMVATYTGYVNYGFDYAGVFAAADTDMAGERFTATFRYDTTISPNDYGTVHSVIGGAAFGNASPMLDSFFRIVGVTKHVAGISSGFAQYDQGSSVSHTSWDNNANGGDLLNLVIFPVNAPGPLNTPFEASVPGLAGGGVAQFVPSPIPGTPASIFSLTVQTVSVAQVPEPATWALMILGFVGCGAALRRKRALLA